MAKVSIIVPVYNVEQYLKRCLDSLVNQTFKDIEILVINDGSPDNSQAIIDEYVSKYEIVKGYTKPNGGLSDARNYGLNIASGEYIMFVDSDDYVHERFVEMMYEKIVRGGYDMVACDVDYVTDEGTSLQVASSNLLDNINIKLAMINIYPSAWNKIYQKRLFNDIRFKVGIWYEDVEMIYRMLPIINNIGVVREPLYKYVQREGAITKTFDNRLYNYIDNMNSIVQYYKDHDYYQMFYKELEYTYVRYIYATFIKQATNYNDKSEFDKAVDSALATVKSNFPKYRKNKYFYVSLKGIYMLLFNKKLADIYYDIAHK